MALLIDVTHAGDGWSVHADTLDTDVLFERGSQAEAAARALASRYAQAGRGAEVRIFLKDGALAGRFLHPADGQPERLAG